MKRSIALLLLGGLLLVSCGGPVYVSGYGYGRGAYWGRHGPGPWTYYRNRPIIIDPCRGGDCGGVQPPGPEYPEAVPLPEPPLMPEPMPMPMPDMGMPDIPMDMPMDMGGFDF